MPENELANLPVPLAEAFQSATPMQQMLGMVLDELGGLAFVADWAEENPSEFMRLIMAANPTPHQAPSPAGGGGTHIHLHPALGPGPLDVEGQIVAEG